MGGRQIALPVHVGQHAGIDLRGEVGQHGLRGVAGARMADQPAGAFE
jgi:hypothetical protein